MQVSLTHIKLFMKFAAKELGLRTLPNINLVGSSEDEKRAFGHTTGTRITVRDTERHPIDVMRTIAHELMQIGRAHV